MKLFGNKRKGLEKLANISEIVQICHLNGAISAAYLTASYDFRLVPIDGEISGK